MINPYVLGENNLIDQCKKISIDNLIKKANKLTKINFINNEVETFGQKISLTTSRTRFNGQRLWFVCPKCSRRINNLYKHPYRNLIGCRICLRLKYRNQRYKGMIENRIDVENSFFDQL
jgi:hypothetical protein